MRMGVQSPRRVQHYWGDHDRVFYHGNHDSYVARCVYEPADYVPLARVAEFFGSGMGVYRAARCYWECSEAEEWGEVLCSGAIM